MHLIVLSSTKISNAFHLTVIPETHLKAPRTSLATVWMTGRVKKAIWNSKERCVLFAMVRFGSK